MQNYIAADENTTTNHNEQIENKNNNKKKNTTPYFKSDELTFYSITDQFFTIFRRFSKQRFV